jgi:hypothetical protein
MFGVISSFSTLHDIIGLYRTCHQFHISGLTNPSFIIHQVHLKPSIIELIKTKITLNNGQQHQHHLYEYYRFTNITIVDGTDTKEVIY